MRMIFQGPLWQGSTSVHRLEAFQAQEGLEVVPVDSGHRVLAGPGGLRSLWQRGRNRLGYPADRHSERRRLLQEVRSHRPHAVFVDSSRLFGRDHLARLRRHGDACLAYYTPDDVVARHNQSAYVRSSFREWDLFFTTKSFNVAELSAAGVRRPVLVGKAFHPRAHAPLTREEVGGEYEAYDAVFAGVYERERARSILALATAGLRVLVYGDSWFRAEAPAGVTVRPSAYDGEYRKCMHKGKIALCFLRKMNRDRITQRSVEIPAMGRPMLAERTEEHDAHFEEGREYAGFRSDEELVIVARSLLEDDDRRRAMAEAGLRRCHTSGYSTTARAQFMLRELRAFVAARRDGTA